MMFDVPWDYVLSLRTNVIIYEVLAAGFQWTNGKLRMVSVLNSLYPPGHAKQKPDAKRNMRERGINSNNNNNCCCYYFNYYL